MGGAIVSAISLRRMKHPQKAGKVIKFAVLAAALFGVVLYFLPQGLGRFVGLGVEAVCYTTFLRIQEQEFAEWQSVNTSVSPTNGWKAVGWGIVGFAMLLGIFFVVFFALAMCGVHSIGL
jgi:hypothetical protein